MSWSVEFEDDLVWSKVHSLLKARSLTQDDIKIIKRWVDIIEKEGFEEIKNSTYWHEHALDGDLRGFRSSAFSNRGRIIYKIIDDKLIVSVVKITPDHDYKR